MEDIFHINPQTQRHSIMIFFFFNDTATTEIYTLSLHDALPISRNRSPNRRRQKGDRQAERRHRPRNRRWRRQDRDRKSTRLNSSHGYISYAVFCLKKKKIKQGTLGALDHRSAPGAPIAAASRES